MTNPVGNAGNQSGRTGLPANANVANSLKLRGRATVHGSMFNPADNDPTIPLDALTHADLLELAELIIADGLLDLSEDALDNLEPDAEGSC